MAFPPQIYSGFSEAIAPFAKRFVLWNPLALVATAKQKIHEIWRTEWQFAWP
jgi:hypothetical protein